MMQIKVTVIHPSIKTKTHQEHIRREMLPRHLMGEMMKVEINELWGERRKGLK